MPDFSEARRYEGAGVTERVLHTGARVALGRRTAGAGTVRSD
ncbi:hypothetical protein ABZ468_10525 [Streptomyces sp. NPDC005708]